jgi:hypothetical protein
VIFRVLVKKMDGNVTTMKPSEGKANVPGVPVGLSLKGEREKAAGRLFH